MADTWYERAVCRGADDQMSLFFEQVLIDGTKVRTDHAHTAVRQQFCARCPVRRQCLSTALQMEQSSSTKYRFGVWGGLTPAQRHSLEKRGGAACPSCGALLDPLAFVIGELECDCGWASSVQPLPEEGDDWRDKHDALAERVVAWLIDNSEVGEPVPRPTTLARTLGARKADVVRVYDALLFDGTLKRVSKQYVRAGSTQALRTWRPPHVAA